MSGDACRSSVYKPSVHEHVYRLCVYSPGEYRPCVLVYTEHAPAPAGWRGLGVYSSCIQPDAYWCLLLMPLPASVSFSGLCLAHRTVVGPGDP